LIKSKGKIKPCISIGLAKSGNEIGLSQEEMHLLDDSERNFLIENAKLRLKKAGAH